MPAPLLDVADARTRVLHAAAPLPAEEVAIDDALGRVLAEEVLAPHDVPPFRNAAMDGFAVRSGKGDRDLVVVGESRAGRPADVPVGYGEAVRISTGALVPDGADAVLQIERVDDRGERVTLLEDVAPGRNVREAGEDVRAGAHLMGPGRRLTPADLGVLVNGGRAAVRCARRPRVAVLATGDELLPPGAPLGPGQIHDSNLVTLQALARGDGAEVVLARHVPDHAGATRRALGEALEAADVVLCSGGVSVGPHDHVKPALAELGVEERFWRVALRPGKPTWFGARGRTLVFGLPGNPVSAMVTYLLFARPALAALQWAEPPAPRRAVLGERLLPHPERDECVRVRLEDGVAYATGPQGSHVLTSMALADGLAVVPRGKLALVAGDPVDLIEI
ncbi:MAG: molybdopterin molybdotransferase MoeA [Solirubrobacteraceae bacterium]|jgi:molybdopterin molybdotransferase|nr:molybdopterin molybdotransferase MoeA [Solirubrobacteraceae bacterium]